jgi:hypothetical protein
VNTLDWISEKFASNGGGGGDAGGGGGETEPPEPLPPPQALENMAIIAMMEIMAACARNTAFCMGIPPFLVIFMRRCGIARERFNNFWFELFWPGRALKDNERDRSPASMLCPILR